MPTPRTSKRVPNHPHGPRLHPRLPHDDERGAGRTLRRVEDKGGRPWERFADPAYIAWRRAVLERDGYRCRSCGVQCKKHERGLAAHHVMEWAMHPALRFDISNGLTLCRRCHMKLHGRESRIAELIPCACGCGTRIASRDPYGRPRRFVNRHGKRGTTMSVAGREELSRERRGRRLSPEHRAKISRGLRTTSKRIGRPPKRG